MIAPQHALVRVKDATTVSVGSEELPYARRSKAIIQNSRGQKALFLQLGHNNHGFVQYLNKDLAFSKRAPYWARLDHWKVIAVIEHCTAYREQPEPSGAIGRFFARFLRDSHKPAYEWLDHPRALAPQHQCPASLWGAFTPAELGL